MDTRVGCYAVVVDDGKVLLAHWNERGKSGWTLPGGGLDPGERPEQGAVREVREETGYDVALDGLLGVDVDEVPAAQRIAPGRGDLRLVRIVYRAHVVGGELTHEADGTTDETRWVPLADVPRLQRVDLVDLGLSLLEARDTDPSAAPRVPPRGGR
jgi:8-oxo-dGTP pyrophosphatase MutT (NUDIX family)